MLRLFLNPDTRGYLRGLAEEFSESTNSVRTELNRLEDAGLLESSTSGNRRYYKANVLHPLFPELRNILHKVTGIDQIIQRVVKRLGGLDKVYLTGQLASGSDSNLIDLVLIGEKIDQHYLHDLCEKASEMVKRRIRTLSFNREEFDTWQSEWNQKLLLLWSSDENN